MERFLNAPVAAKWDGVLEQPANLPNFHLKKFGQVSPLTAIRRRICHLGLVFDLLTNR